MSREGIIEGMPGWCHIYEDSKRLEAGTVAGKVIARNG